MKKIDFENACYETETSLNKIYGHIDDLQDTKQVDKLDDRHVRNEILDLINKLNREIGALISFWSPQQNIFFKNRYSTESLHDNIDRLINEIGHVPKLELYNFLWNNINNYIPQDLYITANWIILQSILDLILTNAVTFSAPINGKVQIKYKEEQFRHVISVANTGKISEEIIHNILSGVSTIKPDGSYSYGLLVAKNLIGILGGSFQISNDVESQMVIVNITFPFSPLEMWYR